MYTLEVNGNFTLVINDLNLVIMPNIKYQLSEIDFNNSSDIKKLKSYLKITKNEGFEDNFILSNEDQHDEEKSTIFIAHDNKDEKVLENVFVKTLDDVVDTKEELISIQLSNEIKNNESININEQTDNQIEDKKEDGYVTDEKSVNVEEKLDSLENENINDLEIKEESVDNIKKEKNTTEPTDSSMKNNKKTKSKEDKLKEDKSKEINPQKKKGRPKTNNK